MDGAYTKLKGAQDALSRSIKVKSLGIENQLKVGTGVKIRKMLHLLVQVKFENVFYYL